MSWLLCQYMISQVQPTKAWKSCFSIPSVVWESSDPFLLKEFRSLIFTFVPASKVLTRVLKSCPFDSLKGEMLGKSKLLVPFAWFYCILCLLFHWCSWELWLLRKCGTRTVIQKSFFSHFCSVFISVLVLSSPVKCIWFQWSLKRSTFSWDSWQSVITQLCTIACFALLSDFVIGVVQKTQIYFIFLLSVILAHDVVLGWPTEEKIMLCWAVMWKAL